jgi:hypothetical protein
MHLQIRASIFVASSILVLQPTPVLAQLPDTLPRRLAPTASGIRPQIGNLCRVQIAAEYQYLGGQRFILQGNADAEQHFFVVADSAKRLRQLYWLQSEVMLSEQGQGYNYSRDSSRTLGGVPWAVDHRLNRGGPRPGSDGAAMVAYVQGAGYEFPALAARLRLVYLPELGGRREFMVIYLEAAAVAGTDTTFSAAFARGTRGVRFFPCS